MKERMNRRSGGVLLLVLGVMTLVLSTVLLAAATMRSRIRATRDALAREKARDVLLYAISNAVDVLSADTNGVDYAGEEWSLSETFFDPKSPYRARLLDTGAFVSLASVETNLLSSVLAGADERMTPEQTFLYASDLLRWREEWREAHEGEAPPSFAFYADAGAASPACVERLRAWGTPWGEEKMNVNTISPELLKAVLCSCGASESLAREMVDRAEGARAGGLVLEAVTRASLARLFLGEGVLATVAEARVFARAERLLGVRGNRFWGRVECLSPRVAIEFVYDREAKRFVAWRE